MLAALLAVSVVSIAAPAANAAECEPGDPTPGCQPCGEKINAITQKPLKDAVIAASWANLDFTHDPIASSLQTSADNAHAVGLLDEVDLKGIYSLDLLNELLQAKIASSKLIPDTTTTAKMTIGRPAFIANDAGKALAARAQAIYKEMDRELTLVPMVGGATDAAFAGRSGKAAVVESFGLAGAGYHARDEYIELDSIVPRLYLMTRLLTEIGNN